MLEIGSLSTKNACSTSGVFDIERIDLFSQEDGILEQDFMERPLPKFEKEQFDIISLSLVLNFLPTAVDRGDMLKRTCQFLDQRAPRAMPEKLHDNFPALFMVVPANCIMNSRYMNEVSRVEGNGKVATQSIEDEALGLFISSTNIALYTC